MRFILGKTLGTLCGLAASSSSLLVGIPFVVPLGRFVFLEFQFVFLAWVLALGRIIIVLISAIATILAAIVTSVVTNFLGFVFVPLVAADVALSFVIAALTGFVWLTGLGLVLRLFHVSSVPRRRFGLAMKPSF